MKKEERVLEETIQGLEIMKVETYDNWKDAEDEINKEYQAGYYNGLKLTTDTIKKENRLDKVVNCLFAIQDELEKNLKEDEEDEFVANLIGYNEAIAFAIRLIQTSILKVKRA